MKDTRAALVEHFKEGRFVHPAALFAPDKVNLLAWLAKNVVTAADEADDQIEDQIEDPGAGDEHSGEALGDEAFREAAE
ncbi:hypothetical protein GGD61_007718 [Bradyrhizobium sp. SBR1B]|nr:hypothetical protein [Bradyrhizobium sp. SBR1B]